MQYLLVYIAFSVFIPLQPHLEVQDCITVVQRSERKYDTGSSSLNTALERRHQMSPPTKRITRCKDYSSTRLAIRRVNPIIRVRSLYSRATNVFS